MLALKLLVVALVGAADSVELVNVADVVLAVAFDDMADDMVALLDELEFAD
jgi:hypothetical protein